MGNNKAIFGIWCASPGPGVAGNGFSAKNDSQFRGRDPNPCPGDAFRGHFSCSENSEPTFHTPRHVLGLFQGHLSISQISLGYISILVESMTLAIVNACFPAAGGLRGRFLVEFRAGVCVLRNFVCKCFAIWGGSRRSPGPPCRVQGARAAGGLCGRFFVGFRADRGPRLF